MTLDKGSLVLLDYTARVKDTNEIFETTKEEDAKKSDHFDPTRKYQPRLVSVGDGWVLKGLDEALTKADIGSQMNVELTPDKAFGERDPAKVRMIPQRKLGDKADEVSVGDVIDVDDRTGIVRFVGSGRIQVDFNHRLAGRTLVYDVNVVKKLETDNEKVSALVKRWLPIDDDKLKFAISDEQLEMDLPEETYQMEGLQSVKAGIARDIFKNVSKVKKVKYVETISAPQQPKPAPEPAQSTEAAAKEQEKPAEAK
ncbi:MAG: FKBP-type peptidyl-prolyl cis-trans isomerase [Nitrososphaera sp.]|jgi:peptidylprolyl isomerase